MSGGKLLHAELLLSKSVASLATLFLFLNAPRSDSSLLTSIPVLSRFPSKPKRICIFSFFESLVTILRRNVRIVQSFTSTRNITAQQRLKRMISQAFFVLVSLLLCLRCSAASVEPSMEPVLPEPVAPGFFLWRAGFDGARLKELHTGDTICPDDHPTGFSVECYGNFKNVRFFVNGNPGRREYKKPFMIAGDVPRKTHPWRPSSTDVKIRCKLAKHLSISIKLTIAC